MALEGTHIRFALDVQDMFEVKDIKKYISGAIYPDSRYPTGIDRTLTHDDSQMERAFWESDDFKKGWAAHLLYDKIQYAVHTEWFGNILSEGNSDMTGEEDWIARTALKILQDIDDVGKFDIKQHLDALEYIETPNGEVEEIVKNYNELFVNIYNKAPDVTIEDLEQMWVDWNVPAGTAEKMRNRSYEIRGNLELMKLVSNIYAETVKRTLDFFNRYCV